MAIRLTSPPHSFVRFSDQHLEDMDWKECGEGELPYCLPVVEESDIVYQFFIETDTEGEADTVFALNSDNWQTAVNFGAPLTSIADSTQFNTLSAISQAASLDIEKYRISDTLILYTLRGLRDGTFETSEVPCGQCFQLALDIGTSPHIYGISNCFRYDCNGCYTALIEYSGNEDEAGFYYCPDQDIINRIRVHWTVGKPIYPMEASVYRMSSGAIKTIKARVGKQYEVETDNLPSWVHDCIVAVLTHDNKYITSAKYTGDFALNGDYTPDWQDFHGYPLAQTKFKMDASPFLIKNNVCGECSFYFDVDDYVFVDPMVDGAPYIPALNLSTLVNTECTPVVYALVSSNPLAVTSISVVGSTLSFTTANPFPTGIGNTLIATYSATCGGVTKQGNIYGHN